EKYSVSSPVKDGMITQTPLVEGVMPAEHVTIDVHYEDASNMLTILYLKVLPDGSTVKAFDTYLAEVQRNTNDYVTSPTLTGYTPDLSVVSGKMPNNATVTVTVTYYPNTYTLSFSDPSGQTFAPVKVKYDNVYGYYSQDGTSFAYGAFPTPLRAGYVFEGWYDGNLRVREDTVFTRTEDVTLTARWTAVSYNVTIRFVNDKGETVAEDIVESLPYDSAYRYDVPAAYGHTVDKQRVEGRVPAQHTVIAVIYQRNSFVLRVEYRDAVTKNTVAETVTLSLRHGDSYSVTSPWVEGYESCSVETVTGVADAPVSGTERTATVYYYEADPVIEVEILWGDLSFDLTERGLWNPQTHTYAPDSFAPTTVGANKVTVSNGVASDVSVSAEYSYTPLVGYEGLQAYFTAGGAEDARLTEGAILAPGETETTYIYVEGNMPPHMAEGSYAAGNCTVTLKGGEANE
ncbi:MAG: MucBP domain-containing protein, partial [Clostridia bacterium]|nr:MucBP domain-containing protein [Clostridia bacterium]